jgi:hypothetical protein
MPVSQRGMPSTAGFTTHTAATNSGHVDEIKSQHKKALKDSGLALAKGSRLEPIVLYSFRHTMLSRLGEAGADAFAIQKIAGHGSVLVSQRYVHPTPERIEGAFAALESYSLKKERELREEQEREHVALGISASSSQADRILRPPFFVPSLGPNYSFRYSAVRAKDRFGCK